MDLPAVARTPRTTYCSLWPIPACSLFSHHCQLEFLIYFPVTVPLTSSNLTNNATFAAEARKQYDNDKTGPYSTPTGDFLAFLPPSVHSKASSSTHAQAAEQDGTKFLPTSTPSEVIKGYRAQHAVLNDHLLSNSSASLEIIWGDGTMILGLQHPYSRGSVQASSASIFDSPMPMQASSEIPWTWEPLFKVSDLPEHLPIHRRLLLCSPSKLSLAPM